MNKVTDLISSNADEINENDEMSQGVNHTQDKSLASLSGQYVKLHVGEHTIFTIEKCSFKWAKYKPSVKHELCSQYKNSPKYFQGGTACQQNN